MTTPYLQSKRHKVWKIIFWLSIIATLVLLLSGCAKTATETVADAAMQQANTLEELIKKECPMVDIAKKIQPLKTTIKAQLATCESEKEALRSDARLWKVVAFSLFCFMMLYIVFKTL